MLSPCCRERTEHLSSSGRGVGGGGCEPHDLLCCRTLVPLGWKGASQLGIKPWPSARQQASTAPSLHQQIWATSMWASSRQLLFCFVVFWGFLLVSNLLFVLACMLLMRREGCWGGNMEKRSMTASEIPAQPLWPEGDVCQSDF